MGEYFGYTGNGSVIKQRQRLGEMLNGDKKLKRRLDKIANWLAKN
ncbi:MAG: hypothetical protein WC853_14710 [Thermodesulfovibrionales bacterium]